MSHNNISGSRGGRNDFLAGVDFYRRVPKDLTEATSLGASMSIVAMGVMAVLFFSETLAFVRTDIATEVSVDTVEEPQIRINFNITMFDLNCDYAVVDVWDALGTNRQNVTKNVDKWHLDQNGRRIYAGRNREMREIRHEESEYTLEELHDDGEHAEPLDAASFKDFVTEHENAFINLYAPWCVWCQKLHPTWELFAEEVEHEEMPIGVGIVDCVAEATLCREQRVMAFPTVRWYHKGQAILPDYKQDRTVSAFMTYAKRKLEQDEKYKNWQNEKGKNQNQRNMQATPAMQSRPDHERCMLAGHLLVNRVPGNFHVEARSKIHNLNPTMTNLSHVVNHLSFGDPLKGWGVHNRKATRILKQVPEEHKQFDPMDDKLYVNRDFHQAYHHYIKVVSTQMVLGADASDDFNTMTTYQFLEQSQIVYYDEKDVPEARFSYDLSPMSVVVKKESRKWYDYLTSLCAIIGGTFTTLGLIDASLYKVFKGKKID